MTAVETNPATWQLQFGARPLRDGSTLFRVWAPRAERLAVKIIDAAPQSVMMERRDGDIFEVVVPDVRAGADYFFVINDEKERPDPRLEERRGGRGGVSGGW